MVNFKPNLPFKVKFTKGDSWVDNKVFLKARIQGESVRLGFSKGWNNDNKGELVLFVFVAEESDDPEDDELGVLSIGVQDMSWLDENKDELILDPAYINAADNNIVKTLISSGCILNTGKTLMSTNDKGMPQQFSIFRVLF